MFKICPAAAWEAAKTGDFLPASPDDRRDGFIHLSTAGQLAGTAARHYAGQADLVLLTVDCAALGDALKWEPSRGGALFPHLYGDLPVSAVSRVQSLVLGSEGVPLVPEDLA